MLYSMICLFLVFFMKKILIEILLLMLMISKLLNTRHIWPSLSNLKEMSKSLSDYPQVTRRRTMTSKAFMLLVGIGLHLQLIPNNSSILGFLLKIRFLLFYFPFRVISLNLAFFTAITLLIISTFVWLRRLHQTWTTMEKERFRSIETY